VAGVGDAAGLFYELVFSAEGDVFHTSLVYTGMVWDARLVGKMRSGTRCASQ